MLDFPAPPLTPTVAAVEHHLPSSFGKKLPEVHGHGVAIPDLFEKAEHHLPLLAPDVLANIPDRLAVLCHGILGQQIDGLSKECERLIHTVHCSLLPDGRQDFCPLLSATPLRSC